MVRALFVRWTGKRTQSPTGRHLPMPVVVSTNARAQKDQGVPPLAADTVASEGDGAARAARVGRRTALAVQQQSTHPVPGAAPKPAEPPCLPAPLMLQTVPRSYAEPQLDARMPVKKHAEDELVAPAVPGQLGAELTCGGAQMPSLRCDAESDEAPRCRICFDGASEEDGDLIEPCACRGTQRYIHKSCLVRWQKVTQTQPHCERAEVCGVCTTPFSILPPPVPEATFIRMLPWWRYGYGSEIAQYAPGVA